MHPKPLNLLVVRTDRIGDVVLTTPAIHALRKHFPDAKITMLVSPMTRDLVADNPDIDEILLDDRSKTHKGLLGFWKQVLQLRSKQFDWAFIFHTKRRTNLFCYLAGIPRRTGYKNEKYGFLLTDQVYDDREAGIKHEAQYCMDVLKAVDIPTTELKGVMKVRQDCALWADQWLKSNHIPHKTLLMLNPSASDPGRQWPADRFAEIAKRIHDHNLGPMVVIGAKNSEAAKRMIAMVPNHVIDLTGQTSMAQLIALMSRCRMLISNDTGPVHIASALDLPVVSIFTRNEPGINPERWRPLGELNKIVVTPYKGSISFRKAEVVDPSYLEMITVDSVWEAVDGLSKLC